MAENVEDADAVIALGLAFGQVVVDRTGFEWVRVSDEFGDETCVAVPGKTLFCSALLNERAKTSSAH